MAELQAASPHARQFRANRGNKKPAAFASAGAGILIT
jgi:hypothetical protein